MPVGAQGTRKGGISRSSGSSRTAKWGTQQHRGGMRQALNPSAFPDVPTFLEHFTDSPVCTLVGRFEGDSRKEVSALSGSTLTRRLGESGLQGAGSGERGGEWAGERELEALQQSRSPERHLRCFGGGGPTAPCLCLELQGVCSGCLCALRLPWLQGVLLTEPLTEPQGAPPRARPASPGLRCSFPSLAGRHWGAAPAEAKSSCAQLPAPVLTGSMSLRRVSDSPRCISFSSSVKWGELHSYLKGAGLNKIIQPSVWHLVVAK